jgi:hypothetical protein
VCTHTDTHTHTQKTQKMAKPKSSSTGRSGPSHSSGGGSGTGREGSSQGGSSSGSHGGSSSGTVGGLPTAMMISLLLFATVSCVLFVYHELHLSPPTSNRLPKPLPVRPIGHSVEPDAPVAGDDATPHKPGENQPTSTAPPKPDVETRGKLICNGKPLDSEVIYWKNVPGDDSYESPITPHHG